MKTIQLRTSTGFTLIELLVVITLIGILAVAVLSALNPAEQVNKAKDARMSADSAQLLSAIDRYYAANLQFPWTEYTAAPAYGVDDLFGAPAYAYGVGVCGDQDAAGNQDLTQDADTLGDGTGGCAEHGLLVESTELKSGFEKRSYFSDASVTNHPENTLWLFKPAGDPTIYVCYKPSAKTNQDKANDTSSALKYLTWSGADGSGTPTAITQCDPGTSPAAVDWTGNPDDWCWTCVPE
ncbi:hypothetical protein A2160_05970 [Candidatus Beckwithbacteria bacterium RBG_13_42_9]|uniref:Type II secretion system protein GspG C-terminal domain-containing protein n=1 Tax=Candidatus Beckwithbacteria bacterium RBG_13_42_9 TaxID=1797457 RepID=A0A1F5E5H4_9BACT|nr:MAG: hypothetical protein A2160_05970 [Candidatus Beckwithbacteria bacterium RBG_13_42_9]